MSNPPPDYGSTPEFGWSLPPEETPLPPPPPPTGFVPPPAPPPSPTTGFGGPPGHYIPGPLTPSQIQPYAPGPIPTMTPVPEPTPVWKRWWFIAAAVLVLIGAGALVVASSGGDDTEQAADTTEETDETRDTDETDATDETTDDTAGTASIPTIVVPPITIPSITSPDLPGISVPELPDITVPDVPGTSVPGGDPSGLPAVGATVDLGDGGTVRLNSVTPGATPTQTFFEIDDGNALTRLDFEVCAGANGFSAFNPLFWEGSLDDGQSASTFLFSFPILVLTIAPGACGRALIDLEAPAERTVVSVGARDYLFQLAAQWNATTPPVEYPGPLTAATPVAASALGTPVSLADGSTVTVRSVTGPGSPIDPSLAPEPGYQYVQADVEVCAGSTAVTIGPSNFFATVADHRLGTSSTYGSTLPSIATEAGQCSTGLVELELPDTGAVVDVFATDELTDEVARWQVG